MEIMEIKENSEQQMGNIAEIRTEIYVSALLKIMETTVCPRRRTGSSPFAGHLYRGGI